MSLQVSAIPTSMPNNAKQHTNRRLANYHPSIWGDHFLSYASYSSEDDDNAKLIELKEEIKRKLMADVKKPADKLELVDAIQRLGVSYHFRSEIDEILQKVYQVHQAIDLKDDIDDLYSISLQFRLLRQHGYNISSDVFNKFRDDGNFKATLAHDIRGILSLYEATHLRTHGENILDEALAFTTGHLKSMANKLGNPLIAEQVKRALTRPLRKCLPRLEARHYLSIYQQEPLYNESLLTFAKLDFNMVQKLHQKELSDISRWWKDLDFANKLPFARDRLVECYFWILGVYFEPEYALARRFLTKVISMTSVTDDIYDAYATIEELELYTSAIERWDMSAMDELPEYMKLCYGALLDVYSEMEKDLASRGKLYRLHYAKEVMKNIVKNYFREAKWCHQKYVPPYEEYLKVALVTSAYTMLATTSFVGMGDIATKESFEWVTSNPKIVEAASLICRLMDDLAGYKFEHNREHVATAIDCYMKQYGVSEEEAVEELLKVVANSWKDMNEELLRPTALPMPLLERVLNLARVISLLYHSEEGDHYTHSYLIKDQVALMLKEPVLL